MYVLEKRNLYGIIINKSPIEHKKELEGMDQNVSGVRNVRFIYNVGGRFKNCSFHRAIDYRDSKIFVIKNQNNRMNSFFDIFQVTLVDSHQHSPEKGAFIATTKLSKLKFLCQWYAEVLSKYHSYIPDLYELSFLYFNCT